MLHYVSVGGNRVNIPDGILFKTVEVKIPVGGEGRFQVAVFDNEHNAVGVVEKGDLAMFSEGYATALALKSLEEAVHRLHCAGRNVYRFNPSLDKIIRDARDVVSDIKYDIEHGRV